MGGRKGVEGKEQVSRREQVWERKKSLVEKAAVLFPHRVVCRDSSHEPVS